MKKIIPLFLSLFLFVGCASFPMDGIIDTLGQAVFDYFNYLPAPAPAPEPQPQPPPVPAPGPVPEPDPVKEEIMVADLDKIPERMRSAGLGPGSDNAFYYALAFVAAFGPGPVMPDDVAGSLAHLNGQREAVNKWFDGLIAETAETLSKRPSVIAIAIKNDARDRCGFRLGPVIVERLSQKGFGDRVRLGEIFPESEY